MSHKVHDAVSLALAQRIAAGLQTHPEWIEFARQNLDQWSARNSDTPSLLACYREWQKLLNLPAHEIAAVLLDPSPDGQRLRQNSPFAGILPPEEVRRIKSQIHESNAA